MLEKFSNLVPPRIPFSKYKLITQLKQREKLWREEKKALPGSSPGKSRKMILMVDLFIYIAAKCSNAICKENETSHVVVVQISCKQSKTN